MSGRIKILLAVLAVGASLSFWYATGFFRTSSAPNLSASLYQQTAPEIANDTDSDGLSDAQEIYWKTDFKNPDTDGDGFKDGEEVLSGHNPAKKGPDDLLNNKTNLTERASSLLLGGIAAGDLNPSNPNYEAAITALVDRIFEQYNANISIELDSISVGVGDDNTVFRYGVTMGNFMKSLFVNSASGFLSVIDTVRTVSVGDISKLRTSNQKQYAKFITAIDAQVSALNGRANALKNISPPPVLLPVHKNVLLFIRGMQQQYQALRAIERDPMQGIIAMQMLSSLNTTTPATLTADFVNRFSNALTP